MSESTRALLQLQCHPGNAGLEHFLPALRAEEGDREAVEGAPGAPAAHNNFAGSTPF